MAILNPPPNALGLASPALGPWFDDNNLTLAAPNERLLVPHTFAASGSSVITIWFPPVNGTLTLAVTTPVCPPPLLGLTDAKGAPAFDNEHLVALFKLLPEVEERLEVLTQILPRPDNGAVNGRRSRARVRCIAMEFMNRDVATLEHINHPSGNGAAHVTDFGLIENAGLLANGPLPMSDLKQPGRTPPVNRQQLATIPDGVTVQFWAFDADGVAIDPGAVAGWWNAIASGNVAPFDAPLTVPPTPSNLWANPDISRTCNVADHLGFRLLNPHRGPIDANLINRLTLPPANSTLVGISGNLFQAPQAGGTTIAFTPVPSNGPDTVPIPLAALLPIGNYAAALTLWPNGPVNLPQHLSPFTLSLSRDYVEVAVLDVESFVCGTVRGPSNNTGTPAERRSADQNRVSTRINVTRSTVALQATIDNVAASFNTLPDGTNPVSIIAPAYDHDWGARTLENLPAGPPPPPTVLPQFECFAIAGGGTADGEAVGEQQVVIRLTLPSSDIAAGAWVRIYPQKIDLDTGRREPQPGGAGRFGNVAANGNTFVAHVVVTLPPGRIDGKAQLGVDVMIVPGVTPPTVPPAGRLIPPVVYADQRITRPPPTGGTAVSIADITDVLGASALVLDCDQAATANPGSGPPGTFRSGSTLLAWVPGSNGASDTFTLIDHASVPLPWFDNATLGKTLTSNDVIAVTTPAFVGEARGNTNPAGTNGVNALDLTAPVQIQTRNVTTLGNPGVPLPSQERLEFVGLRNAGSGAGAVNIGVVGSAPALAAWHELLPTQAGNPTAPGGKEVHGAGVQITGGTITDIADFMRDRLITDTFALASDAGSNALPTQAINLANAQQWAAVLKTVARGVEGEIGLFETLDLADRSLFDTYDSTGLAPGLPNIGAMANVNGALRAVCRRVLNGLGRQEALFALNAAIDRAERLIYIETPAIDGEAVNADGANLAWLDTLIARLEARPALHVALCLPRELLPGTPQPLASVRNQLWQSALARLLTAAGNRVAVFSPGAGPYSHVRIASTVVVVDDVWAMIGTTHLSRRGLSFDSSLAVAVFDEANQFSRGTAVSAFRVQLAADRLGVAATQIPLVGHEFVTSLRRLVDSGGVGRLALGSLPVAPAGLPPTDSDAQLWNPDGSTTGDLDIQNSLAAHLSTG